MDKQVSLPHRIHRLYGQFYYLCFTNIYYLTHFIILLNNRQALVPHIEDMATSVIAVNTEEGVHGYYPH